MIFGGQKYSEVKDNTPVGVDGSHEVFLDWVRQGELHVQTTSFQLTLYHETFRDPAAYGLGLGEK